MQIITSRELRTNQKKYFDLAENEPVFVLRRGARPVSISAVNDDDILSSEALRSIARGLDDIKQDKVYKMGEEETLGAMLDRVGDEL